MVDLYEDNLSSLIVVSIVESRARERFILEISIICDSHSYNETIMLLQEISPDEILLHDSCREKVLSKNIESGLKRYSKIIFLPGKNFDQDRGAQLLERLKFGTVDSDLIARYMVLSGSHCILRYVEQLTASPFPRNCLKIIWNGGFNVSQKMTIDRRSSVNLELVADKLRGDQQNTLFGVVNFCKTTVGTRLMRSTILRPLTNIASISGRHRVVEALLRNNCIFSDLIGKLLQYPDLDKMLNGLLYCPKSFTITTMKGSIDSMLFLKEAIKVSESLAEILLQLQSEFDLEESDDYSAHTMIATTIDNLTNPSLKKIESDISQLLAVNSQFLKAPYEWRYQECFAIIRGYDGKLDVLRQTYMEGVDEMNQLAEEYSRKEGFSVKLHFTAARGYFLSVPCDLHSLPGYFIQAVLNKNAIYCTTFELISISDRITEAIVEALRVTDDIIASYLETIREDIGYLFNLVDSVAFLDLIASFADLVALSHNKFKKPTMVGYGPMVIRNGYHPVVSKMRLQRLHGSFIANDLSISNLENFQIVLGANGSGKLAHITILAQIGCFVPASYALIPLRNKILSRIGNNDDIEHNLSTFAVEMQEVSYIIDQCTSRSLVLIDELGRGTSNIDGLSIALAVAEFLLLSKAFVLFTSHYPQMVFLEQLYANVKTVSMKTISCADKSNNEQSLYFTHQLHLGHCELHNGYGIIFAEMCGFPERIVEDAQSVRHTVGAKLVLSMESFTSKPYPLDFRKKIILERTVAILDSFRNRSIGPCSSVLPQMAAVVSPQEKI